MKSSSAALILLLLIVSAVAFVQFPHAVTVQGRFHGGKVSSRVGCRPSMPAIFLSDADETPAPIVQNLKESEAPVVASKCDYRAIRRYFLATTFQWTVIVLFLKFLQFGMIKRLPTKIARVIVFGLFAFLAVKSRVFSSLDNSRPSAESEKIRRSTSKQPWWTPPRIVFPFVWATITVLRAVSSTLIWEACGSIACKPIIALVAHLSIGDTWNTINNVEQRRGTSVVAVFVVWLSVVFTTRAYYKALPLAGLVLLPSAVWISVANYLIFELWRLNGKEPLYPVLGLSSAAKDSLSESAAAPVNPATNET